MTIAFNYFIKHKLTILTTASTISALGLSALGQETTAKTGQSNYAPGDASQAQAFGRLNQTIKASEIIGMTVRNLQDQKLGKVADIDLDVEAGRIVQVIVASGGFLGMGEKITVVPPEAFAGNETNKVLELNLSQEKFRDAPKFDSSNWSEETQSNRLTEVYNYYDEKPYFALASAGFGTADSSFPRNMDGTIDNPSRRAMNNVRNEEVIRNSENNDITSTNIPDAAPPQNWPNGSMVGQSWSPLGYVQKTRQLMGLPVNNLQGEKLGKVENFIVDLSVGRVVAVVISSGGYLGMDDEVSAVPPTVLRFNSTQDALQLDTSKETLAAAPHFQANNWPDFNQRDYTSGVYRAYNVHPYFVADLNGDVDNTRNGRTDRSPTLKPLDQSNRQADRETTAEIREDIMADKERSLNGQNVKIITARGHVTLRGSVNTEAEKSRIGDIANHIAQAQNVDNQLQVTPVTTSNN